MHYHYTSGLQFLLDQSQQKKDWQSYLRMLPMVATEMLKKTFEGCDVNISSASPTNEHHFRNQDHGSGSISSSSSTPTTTDTVATTSPITLKDHPQHEPGEEQLWQLWRWKPPIQSSLQSRDDYFHKPASTPHSIMNEFKKHLTVSKDMNFKTSDLRRLAEIEFQPLMSFVTQDDYDDHTDSIVRSYFIFKDGVMPLWEDEHNVFGGCWSLIINNNHYHLPQPHNPNHDMSNASVVNSEFNPKKTSKHVWKQLINLLTDSRMMKYADELCGVGLTIRSNKTYKITVWNRNSYDTITKIMIGANIKAILNHEGPMFYYSHKSTLKNQYERKKFDKVRRRIFEKKRINQNQNNNHKNQNHKNSQWSYLDDYDHHDVPLLNSHLSSGFMRQQNQRLFEETLRTLHQSDRGHHNNQHSALKRSNFLKNQTHFNNNSMVY